MMPHYRYPSWPRRSISTSRRRVRPILAPDLAVESIEAPREPQHGELILRGRLTTPSHVAFPRWLRELRPLGFTPMLRPDPNPHPGDPEEGVVVYIMNGVPAVRKPRPWINLVLFLATVVSTLFVGMIYGGDLNGVDGAADLFRPAVLLRALPFSATILSILLAHEFGHYFTARYHNIAVSLPFFIPMPYDPGYTRRGDCPTRTLSRPAQAL